MKNILLFFNLLFVSATLFAQDFETYFTNKTLRLDYIFSGNAKEQAICLDQLASLPSWAGRRHNLSQLPLQGNGQITIRDVKENRVIYCTSFSSLFQEWVVTEEAKNITKGFENTFLVPYPLKPIEVEVTLRNARQEVSASFKHIVNPDDILIREKGTNNRVEYKYLLHNGNEEKHIDVAILAEGYKKEEMEVFYKDAEIAYKAILQHEPFTSLKDRFNFIAIATPSEESGVSIPRLNQWKRTAFGSHFSTFYSDRYLTTSNVKDIHDAIAGIPYEHIIILANTDEYGGGGIYNSYTLTTAHHPQFKPVVVHEFGHSFGGLADEYFYEGADEMAGLYPLDIEPWEQNITTLVDFTSKWKNSIKKGTPIPTPQAKKEVYITGVYEGAGYSTKGVYRPADNCRMRTNEHPTFCPACQQALTQLINFYTE